MPDLVNRVETIYSVTGLDTTISNLERVAQAEARLATQSAGLGSATAGLDQSTLSAQRALDSFSRGLDPAAKYLAQYERGLRLANTATAQGAPLTDAHARALANAKSRWEEATKSANDNAKAIHGHGEATAKLTSGAAELEHALRSMGGVMAAGGSIFSAVEVEAGRLLQVAASDGGLAGAFSVLTSRFAGIATGAAALLTPMVLLTGSIVGIGAAAAYSSVAFELSQEKLGSSMDGIGRRAGATLAQLNAVAAAGARAGGLSTSQGVELAAGFNRAGIGADQSQTLIGATRGYAHFTGSSVAEAGASLAGSFADPVKGLDELDKQLGFVSGALRTQVTNLEAQGNLEDARTVAIEAFNKAMAGVTDTTWGASRAFDSVKNAISNAFGTVGHAIDRTIFGDTPTKSAQQVEKERQEAVATEKSGRADAVVRSILPDLVRAQTASNNITLLRSALSDHTILDNMGVLPGQTQRAYSNLTVQAANASPALRQQQDYELAKASADAFSVAEKAAVDARRAELTVLRETGDLTRAQAAAQMAVNEAILKANSDAKDRLGMAKQEAAYVGLTSYQRGRQQIVDSYEGYGGQLSKDAASRSDLAEAMKPVANDLRTAGQEIAAAIREAAALIAPGKAASPYGDLSGVKFGSGPGIATPAMIADASARTGISPSIITAIGSIENGGKLTGGTSMLGSNGKPSSAYGYGQLTNGAAADVAKAVPGFSKYDPSTAVFGSAEYLKILAGRNGGDITKALNAYGGTTDYASKVYSRGGNPLTITPAANSNVATVGSTAYGSDKSAEGYKLNAFDRSAQQDPINEANAALANQNRLLDLQYSTLGKTKSQIDGAAASQALMNHYLTEHIAISPDMQASIQAIGDKTAEASQRAADFAKAQQQLIGAMDGIRGAADQGLGTFVDDLMKGKSAGTAIRDVLHGLGEDILKLGEHSLVSGLFGGQGQAGGGLFGGGLSSLFGGGGLGSIFGSIFGGSGGSGGIGHNAAGTQDWGGGPTWVGEKGPEIVNLPQHAQVVSNTAARSSGGGAAIKTGDVNVHIYPVGGAQFTPDQIASIQGHVASGVQQGHQQTMRDLQTINAANQQYAA